ncbi:DUF5916 domain-containing protein [Chryseosolibacter indicus]|uniref:Carbohydrate binding family 9 domain-containing protein n=1 Tax=Chryseosolibacter indicus TaxID=2782351 RepID=A0ABS5VQE9_9BACT|nr:DUF5916 domain-containing protein [Chryseosolibacter indicus]MBT1703660.1 carbohydrate binding family 9 domain-containing protein [Chryseosolibacter indicus]
MTKRIPLFLFLLFCSDALLFAQQDSVRSYVTKRLEGDPPKIDGILNDAAWEQVPWGGGQFRQKLPDAGAPASVETFFKILYDDKNLYIAFRNLDPEPGKIVSRMSRRDGFEGDWVEINIDSYNDKRTAFSFTSSVSGVKGDEYVSNNGDNWDANWDPIWYLKTSINSEGWIAELRIPLSQLRFADKPELVWGFQIQRHFFRNQEVSNFQYIPPDAAGWVHLFAELRGIKGIKPQKQLEVLPYIVTKAERFEKEEGNPFMTGSSSGVDVGVDAKIGITSDITLDLSVNPDFGQVEADPSQVNLSAFRLFFEERRPFFIEGNNTLNFPIVSFNSNNLFYSRRIGRTPQREIETDESGEDNTDEYVKTTKNSTILGAVKLTGKNKKGFSWGLLESVTAPERASVDSLGHRQKQMVEPLTNYFVGRVQQDINKGNTVVGGMITATNRRIEDKGLNWLHDKAYTTGVDFLHHWKNRTYFINARGVLSYVGGSTEAITNTQKASERYFQRPDNNHKNVDTTLTSLSGTGGVLMLGKKSGKLIFDVGYTWLSPELELNDIGFLSQTDMNSEWVWMEYRMLNPVGIFRSMRYSLVQWQDWDFDWKNIGHGYELNANLEFKNFWNFSAGTSYTTHGISNADLRGGPSIRYPGNFTYWFSLATDRRKKLSADIEPQWKRGFENYMKSTTVNVNLNYTPINAFRITVSPSISKNRNQMQYVATGDSEYGQKFVVAELNQTIARVTVRMTYMVTPDLSIQYYGQPFGTSGRYTKYKGIINGSASRYNDRFAYLPHNGMTMKEDVYHVDDDLDGVTDFTFDKPDFNIGQFRSNLVMRWEYVPGSVVFLVWSQEVNGEFYSKTGSMTEGYNFYFPDKAHNIFLLKFTYRFVR